MKDKHARTTQTFSLPLATAEPNDVAKCIAEELGLVVHSAKRHVNKLRRGHLAGNRFRILVADVGDDAYARSRGIAAELARRGVPNYFGAQRGGDGGRNVARGRELLSDKEGRRGKQRSWAGRFLVSAYQSSLFNEWLAERMSRGLFERLLEGDVAKRRADGALFDVKDLAAEQARFDAHEIVHTGPIVGSRTRWAAGAPGEIERALLARAGLEESAFARAGAKGSRRAGLLRIDDLEIDAVPGGLVFAFTLPKGSYATVYLREFMKPMPSELELTLAVDMDDE
jgi:tRNA pseudouridine13 synthase